MAQNNRQGTSHPAIELLLHATGPFATVYLPAPSAVENADQRFVGAVKSASAILEGEGAEPELVDAVTAAADVVDHADGDEFAIVASPGRTWVWPMHTGVAEVQAWFDSLPRVAPLLAAEYMAVPHIRVVADRAGAEVAFVDNAAREVEVSTTVEGSELHLHRGHPGGWSQRRFQQRAENTWEQNAGAVVDNVVALHDRTEAEAVTVAGEERAVGFVVEQLPPALAEKVIEVEHGGRAAGVDVNRMQDEILRHLLDLRLRQEAETLNWFRDHQAAGTAVYGVEPTLRALFEGVADTLIIDARLDDETVAFHGSEPHHVAEDAADLQALGLSATPGPAVETAVRAAAATGCEVRFLAPSGRGPVGFFAAVLRARRDNAAATQ